MRDRKVLILCRYLLITSIFKEAEHYVKTDGKDNSMDPLGMGINSWVNDREEYNQNLAQCRADEDAFRAYARQIQDEMLAEVSSDGAEGVPNGAE